MIGSHLDAAADGPVSQRDKRESSLSSLGPLKDAERKDINCAVKEYLLFAGYRLTAMTFIEEVCGNPFTASLASEFICLVQDISVIPMFN